MKKINAIIILIIIILVAGIGILVYTNMGGEIEYTNLQISSNCVLSVPVSNDATNSTDSYGIFYYQDKQYNLNITSLNTQDNLSLGGAAQIATLRDSQLLGCKPVQENGTTYYLNEKTGVYSIFITDEASHNNILISCTDLDILKHVVNSVKMTPTEDNNQTNNTVSKTSTADIDESLGFYDYDGDGICDWGQNQGMTKDQIKNSQALMEEEMEKEQALVDSESEINGFD